MDSLRWTDAQEIRRLKDELASARECLRMTGTEAEEESRKVIRGMNKVIAEQSERIVGLELRLAKAEKDRDAARASAAAMDRENTALAELLAAAGGCGEAVAGEFRHDHDPDDSWHKHRIYRGDQLVANIALDGPEASTFADRIVDVLNRAPAAGDARAMAMRALEVWLEYDRATNGCNPATGQKPDCGCERCVASRAALAALREDAASTPPAREVPAGELERLGRVAMEAYNRSACLSITSARWKRVAAAVLREAAPRTTEEER